MRLASGRATVLLLRHGETSWNREGRVMGNLDVPLNDDGRAQCEAAAALLAGLGVTRILASPLRRAAETAAIVSAALGLEVTHDERLVEVRFGDWQGLTYEEVSRDPRYREFAANPAAAATPAGETIAMVQGRGLEALASVGHGEVVLAVTHGDIIRSMLCHFVGAPLAEYRRLRADNCGISAVALSAGPPEVKFLNLLADPVRATAATHWRGRSA